MKISGEFESKQNNSENEQEIVDEGDKLEDPANSLEQQIKERRELFKLKVQKVLNRRNPKSLPIGSPTDFQRELRKEIRRSTYEDAKFLYGIMDSPIDSFATEFYSVLPEDFKLDPDQFRQYIEGTLSNDTHKPLAAIEFGGPGFRLFGGFTDGFFDHTIGVCLKYEKEKSTLPESKNSHHEVISGNIFRASTYRSVRRNLGDGQVGLIISRMAGPLHDMTRDPVILGKIISTWYSFLTDESSGLMFIEYPKSVALTDIVKGWRDYINENFSDSMEVQAADNTLRLLKKKGAPKVLPLLPTAQ